MRLLLCHFDRLGVVLAAAEFVFTEPYSKRLMLRLRLRGEVLHGSGGGVTLEQGHVVEFAVHDRLCDACAMARARAAEPPDQCGWSAVVQVRQRASHRRTLLHLEQQVVTHGAASDALRVGAVRGGGGLDFFASRSHAARLVDLVTSPWPARVVAASSSSLAHLRRGTLPGVPRQRKRGTEEEMNREKEMKKFLSPY